MSQVVSTAEDAASKVLAENISPNPFGTVPGAVDGNELAATIRKVARVKAKSGMVIEQVRVNDKKLFKAVRDIVASHRPDLINKATNRLNDDVAKQIMEGIVILKDNLLSRMTGLDNLSVTQKYTVNTAKGCVDVTTTARGKSAAELDTQLVQIKIAIREAEAKLQKLLLSANTNADREFNARERINKLKDVQVDIELEIEKQNALKKDVATAAAK